MAHTNPNDRKRLSRDHYVANRATYIARASESNKQNRERIVALIREAKNRPCVDCGVRHPFYVMQFDHVRGKKLFTIGDVKNRSLSRVAAEIAKCEVVCANCHAERTYQRAQAAARSIEQTVVATPGEAATLF